MESPLFRAFDLLVRSADTALADRALRSAIGILVSADAHAPEPRPPPASNGAAARSPNPDIPVIDWEPLRAALHRIVSSSSPAQRITIAGELGIAHSSLRNFISNAVPGQAVAARVQQWLQNRQNDDVRCPTADVEARIGAEPSGNGIAELPRTNGAASNAIDVPIPATLRRKGVPETESPPAVCRPRCASG